jgi:hypothetical protein
MAFKWPRKAIIVMIIFIILTPLGILATGEAWGEWDISEWPVSNSWKNVATKIASIWSAPLPDYNIPSWESGILPYIGYIVSGVIGVIILIFVTYFIGYLIVRRKK